ncbi:MAG: pyrimidine-nucleoside phosphorylase [Oscillospiraceae bacterium]|nr:pyrimidine-nucleoside phosphorylase [Oscillospiraceae bacterium]
MRMYDIIAEKKAGLELTYDEIEFAINGFVSGEIPDYQMSALLMAIYFKGMSNDETTKLTMCMANSGDTVDLSAIDGIKADKHSTGGVGDKTTLVVAPVVAACGVHMAKMSGRGLGHTGGTVDKLEAIPGFNVSVSREDFISIVNKIGLCVVGQTGNLAPADKKLYALRDVTATIDCVPLIASSIMSKKLAAGADCILLDVKTGSGAFMKTAEDSITLAKVMVDIGWGAGKKCAALVTDMDNPLGYAIGNSLEVIEAVDTLKGKGPQDFADCCMELSANILELAGKGNADQCMAQAKAVIASGAAFQKLCEMVEAQGGNAEVIKDTTKFGEAPIIREIVATTSGYISSMDTESIGITSVMLGAGRETKDSPVDHLAGILLRKKTGDYIKVGDTLAVFHTSHESLVKGAAERFTSSLKISESKPDSKPLVYAKIEKDRVTIY